MSRKQKLEDAARLIDSADALWEGFPDTNFLYERIKHYEGSEKLLLEDETCWKRAVIDLLRSNIPLREHTRRLLAGDLEKAWFESPRESARKHRQFLASVYEQLIAWSVEGAGITKQQAKEQLVKDLGLPSIEALEQHLKRAKRERRKGDKPS